MVWKLVDHLKRLFYCDGGKHLPMSVVIIIFINIVFYSMATNVVFVFLPQMVKYLGATEINAGYYAGVIASSVYVGRFFFSIFWGYLADIKSKRFSVVCTGSCLLATTLAFGLSTNFYWATLTRFLQGCSMGHIIISKAILADVCDDTTMALGLSVLLTASSVGGILGPIVGGFLVFPGQQYPHAISKENIFGKFGVLLPNFIIAIGLGIGIVLSVIILPKDKKQIGDRTILINAKNNVSYGAVDGINGIPKSRFSNFLHFKLGSRNRSTKNHGNKHTELYKTAICQNTGLTLFQKFKRSKFVKVLKIKECLYSSLLYGLFSVADVGFCEVFLILAATDPTYKGMGYSTSQLGAVLMVVSLLIVILQITLIPKLNKHFGSKNLLISSCLTLTFLYPMLPVVAAIHNRTALWICLILLIFVVLNCSFTGYLSINILVNNSVGPDLLGSANGIAMTIASVGRLIAPLLSGSLYSWSLRNIKGIDGNQNALGFPFNQFFTFYVFSIWSIFVAVCTSTLPERMNTKKIKTECAEPCTSREQHRDVMKT